MMIRARLRLLEPGDGGAGRRAAPAWMVAVAGSRSRARARSRSRARARSRTQVKGDNRFWARPVPSGKWRGSASLVWFRRAAAGFVGGAVRLPLGHGGCVLDYQTAPPEST